MPSRPEPPLVVLDTMVVVRSVMGRHGNADSSVLRAVAVGDVRLAISDDGLTELQRVMGYDFVRERAAEPARVFAAGLDVGMMGRLFRPRKLDWSILPDPKDHWVLDLALEAGSAESRAPYIVTRDGHFLDRRTELEAMGFRILTPEQLLEVIPSRA